MSAIRPSPSALVLSVLVTVACSSATSQPNSPSAATEPAPGAAASTPEPKAAPAAEGTTPKASAQAKESAPPPQKPEPEVAPEQPAGPPPLPSEILTAENVAFELDEEASAIRLILQDKCEQRVGYESDAVARCLESERANFPADVLRFRKIGGQLRWTVYKRKGEKLQVVYSAPVVFTEETDYTVSVLPQGGTGYRPLMSQSSHVPLSFPSVQSIELDDPLWGLLVYRSKTGLVE